jgi:hypothetical protein
MEGKEMKTIDKRKAVENVVGLCGICESVADLTEQEIEEVYGKMKDIIIQRLEEYLKGVKK